MSKVYEEALADLSKLKQIAEQDASHKLLESVKPHVKALIEQELMNLDDFGGAEGQAQEPLEIDTESEDSVDNAPPAIPTAPAATFPSSAVGGGKSSTPVKPSAAANPEPSMTADVVAATMVPEIPNEEGTPCAPPVVDGGSENVVPNVEDQEAEEAAEMDAEEDLVSAEGIADEVNDDDDDVYELDFDASNMVETIKRASTQKLMSEQQIARKIALLGVTISGISESFVSRRAQKKIKSLIESVESTYSYVQEFLPGSKHRVSFEEKLEEQYSKLNSLTEQRENKMKKTLVNEEDLTLKLTGLPELDDDQLAELGVDLVAGEGEDEVDLGDGSEGGDEDMGGDDDSLDFDLGGDEDSDDMAADDDMEEQTMIEIDENDLKLEIRNMLKARTIREEKSAAAALKSEGPNAPKGEKPSADEADDFGDGKFVKEGDESCDGSMEAVDEQEKKDEKGKKLADGHMTEGKARQNGKLQAATTNIRKQLAEANLLNVKLVYTNKLLQSEALTKKQKAAIVERLDEATNMAEAKLIYESLTKALARTQAASQNRVIGSSSSVVGKSGSTDARIDEGYSTARWAKLAGLLKD